MAISMALRKPADWEDPPIRQEVEVDLRQSVHGLPFLDDPPQGRVRLVSGTPRFRLDDREVRVLHFAEHLFDVDHLSLAVLQRLEHALHEVSAQLRPEHLEPPRVPHVEGLLEVLDPEVPAVLDAVDRDGLHEGLPRGEVVRLLEKTIAVADRKSTRLNSSHVRISYAV